ncbi:MAG: DUF1579 domain-containing protein [Candidatus Eisenbacteria bacterium]
MKKITGTFLAVAFALACVSSSDGSETPGDEAAAMQDMMTPGPHHEMLGKLAGDWTYTSKMWMDPAAPPMESVGTSHMATAMNGLFLTEDVEGNVMGMPWLGHGTYGFDKGQNKHIGVWYDSFGTMMIMFEGDCTDHCKTVTMTGSYLDPMSGQPATMKMVTTHTDDDHAVNEMFNVAGGQEVKMVEVHYTRKK